MSARPRKPQLKRRHRRGGRILVQQRHQRVDVVPLERVDVALQKILLDLGAVRGRRSRKSAAASAADAPSSKSVPFTASSLLLEQAALPSLARQLSTSRRISTGALAGGEALKSGDEREPHCFTRHHDRRRVALLARQKRVGDRPLPPRLRPRVSHRRLAPARRPQLDRQRATPPPLEHVLTDVGRDAVQPGTQTTSIRGKVLETLTPPPSAKQRVLHGVLSVVRRREHSVAVPRQLAPIRLEIAKLDALSHWLTLTTSESK